MTEVCTLTKNTLDSIDGIAFSDVIPEIDPGQCCANAFETDGDPSLVEACTVEATYTYDEFENEFTCMRFSNFLNPINGNLISSSLDSIEKGECCIKAIELQDSALSEACESRHYNITWNTDPAKCEGMEDLLFPNSTIIETTSFEYPNDNTGLCCKTGLE